MARMSTKIKLNRIQRYLNDIFKGAHVDVTFHIKAQDTPSEAPESPVEPSTVEDDDWGPGAAEKSIQAFRDRQAAEEKLESSK